ncbi:MAG: CpsD/CapB family tyrosine-protein kinase [Chloroflexota bacterium]
MTGSSNEKNNGAGLVMVQAPRSAAAEAYRTLSTNIQFSSLDRDVRTLLVTSVGPNEGKSVVLANLAITMAQSGKRVAMVDCDLRHPALHTVFGLTEQPGLTTMMLDDQLAVPLQATSTPNVSLVAAGPLPPNPSELISSERFARVLASIGEEADIVLVDAPPVSSVTDASILATRVDGVLLVVDSGRTRRDTARRATDQLQRVGARILGAVLTNVKGEKAQTEYLST